MNPSQKNFIGQLSIECVIFGYQSHTLKVLVPKLAFNGDFWALPSGFIDQNEDIDAAASRILLERTGIDNVYMEQFKVFGKASRENKDFLNHLIEQNPERLQLVKNTQSEYDWFIRRFVSIGYYALVDINQVQPQLTDLDQSIEWYDIHDLPVMIIDHNEIVHEALHTLRGHLNEKLNAFNLLPDKFTMKDLQNVYEAVYDKPFVRTNFQKMILNLNVLERLEKKFTGAANKAPYEYKLK